MKGKALSFAVFFVAHSVSATAAAFLLAWIFGGLTPLISAVSIVFSLLRARRFVRAIRNTLEWRATESVRRWTVSEVLVLTFVVFAAFKHFMWLMPTMSVSAGPSIVTLSPTNYGDLPLHLNYIRELASGVEFLPVNPGFAVEPLRYPFGPDLYSALWESLGLQTSGHLFLVGLMATVSSLVLLRELGGVWAMAAFFLAGGAVAGVTEVDWKSFFLSIWITQRGMLWALPIGLMLILYLRPHLSGTSRLPQRAVAGLGRMWAVFPLFHAHSFVIVSMILFFLTWRDFGFKRTETSRGTSMFFRRFFLQNRALAWAIVPASLLIFHTSAAFSKASIVRWRWFWLMPEAGGISAGLGWFWKNFGNSLGALLLLSFGVFAAKRVWLKDKAEPTQTKSSWIEAVIAVALFTTFFFVMLAPWEWDNVKVLLWPWILMFGILGRNLLLLEEGDRTKLWSVISALGLVVAFHQGTMAIAKSWEKPQDRVLVLWTVEQIANAQAVLGRIPAKAVFAAAQTPTHVLTYFGRIRILGYAGHLWSHGLDYSHQEAELENVMTGGDGWIESAKRLGITHVYWGPEEKTKWGDGPKPWQERLPRIAGVADHEIYEFKEAR